MRWQQQEPTFKPYAQGDQVWLEGKNLNTTYPKSKLAPKRFGPFTITKVISETAYRLDLPHQWHIHNVFHPSLLTPFEETEEHGPAYPRPPPDIVEGNKHWEVETIINSKIDRRYKSPLRYLIKWAGYPDAENTWQGTEDMYASDEIADFHRRNPKAAGPKDL